MLIALCNRSYGVEWFCKSSLDQNRVATSIIKALMKEASITSETSADLYRIKRLQTQETAVKVLQVLSDLLMIHHDQLYGFRVCG